MVKPNRSIPSAVVIPVLIYPDVREAVAWLSTAFGFEERLDFLLSQFLNAIDRFFQNRIFGDLLRNHVLQFQTVQLKDRHHLDEPGG